MDIFLHRSHDAYVAAQIRRNKEKFEEVFVQENEIRLISKQIVALLETGPLRQGLCHGVRNGTEVQWFRRFLPCVDVVGTDISPTVVDVKNCRCLDYHLVPKKWVGKFDFVYSNSLDHSYDPSLALRSWFSELRPGGLCIVQWAGARANATPTPADCLSGTYKDIADLLVEHGELVGYFTCREGKFAEVKTLTVRKPVSPSTSLSSPSATAQE